MKIKDVLISFYTRFGYIHNVNVSVCVHHKPGAFEGAVKKGTKGSTVVSSPILPFRRGRRDINKLNTLKLFCQVDFNFVH